MSESKFQFIDEEKEITGEDYSGSDQDDAPKADETEVEVGSTDNPKDQEDHLKVGDRVFDSVDDLMKFAEERDKSYTNLQSLNGKQTNELGDLRKMVEELKERMEPEKVSDPTPEFDEYDPAKQKEYIEYMATKKAKDIIDQRFKDQESAKAENDYKDAMDAMLNDFVAKHPELDKDQLAKIAAFGDERGITYIDDAYNLWNIQSQPVKDAVDTKVDKAKKATEANKIPTTLSNVSSGNESDLDFDSLTPEQWSNLTDDVRKQALQEVDPGF